MKLVEILARELKEWPEGSDFARQDADREICFEYGGFDCNFMAGEEAEDNIHDSVIGIFRVTRAQWEAERARIALEQATEVANQDAQDHAWMQEKKQTEQELAAIACGKRSKEDQELWDKVAISALNGMLACQVQPQSGADMFARDSATLADAFMAERAKRMK